MFETIFAGRNKIWGGAKNRGGGLPQSGSPRQHGDCPRVAPRGNGPVPMFP